MRSEAGKQFTFDQESQAVFTALVAAAQSNKQYELVGVHNDSRRIVVHRKRSMFNWGNFFFATVEDMPGGASVNLIVTGMPGAPQALLDGMKNRKEAEKFIEAAREALRSGTTAELPQDFMIGEDGNHGPWDESLLEQ